MLTIQTDNPNDTGSHRLLMWATYGGDVLTSLPSTNVYLYVNVVDPCATANLNIDPTILTALTIDYNIGHTEII